MPAAGFNDSRNGIACMIPKPSFQKWRRFSPLVGLALIVLVTGQTCTPPADQDPGPNGNNSGNGGPNPQPEEKGLPAEQARVAFASQCALNVIQCTVAFPEAVIDLAGSPGQVVSKTPEGWIVQGTDGDGVEEIRLVGVLSTAGQGATELFYSWSKGATDTDPKTLRPGTEFSREIYPVVELREGFHYIRLTVTNDILVPSLESPTLGTIAENVYLYDFQEVEIEIRD